MVFAIQKANLADIQSSRFRWYSFAFERTQIRLVSLLVNFSCELGQIMTRYDFLWARWVILNNVRLTPTWPNFTFGQLFMWIGPNNDYIWLPMDQTSDSEQCSNQLQFDLISLLVIFSCDLGQIMTRYDLLWARRVILSNVQTWPNFEFGQLFIWIGANRWIFWEKNPKWGLKN